MISSCSFLYTLVLVSELSGHMVAAMPAPKVEDEGLGLMLGDEPAALPPVYGRLDAQDGRLGDRRSKIIVVSVSATFDSIQTSLSSLVYLYSLLVFCLFF